MSDFAWWLGVAAVPWLGVALQIALAAYQWRMTQRMKVIRAAFATIGSDARPRRGAAKPARSISPSACTAASATSGGAGPASSASPTRRIPTKSISR